MALVAQRLKRRLQAARGWFDPIGIFEKEMAATLFLPEIPMTEEPGRLQIHGVTKKSDTTERLHHSPLPITMAEVVKAKIIHNSCFWKMSNRYASLVGVEI